MRIAYQSIASPIMGVTDWVMSASCMPIHFNRFDAYVWACPSPLPRLVPPILSWQQHGQGSTRPPFVNFLSLVYEVLICKCTKPKHDVNETQNRGGWEQRCNSERAEDRCRPGQDSAPLQASPPLTAYAAEATGSTVQLQRRPEMYSMTARQVACQVMGVHACCSLPHAQSPAPLVPASWSNNGILHRWHGLKLTV